MKYDLSIRFPMNRSTWLLAIREQLMPKGRSGHVLWTIVWLLLSLAVIQYLRGRSPFKPVHVFGSVVFWGAIFGLWFYRRSARHLLKGISPELLECEQSYRFTDLGVEGRGPLGESRLDWRVWTSCVESVNFFGLVQTSGSINAIPKSAFSDEKQRQSFRELLRLKLHSSKP